MSLPNFASLSLAPAAPARPRPVATGAGRSRTDATDAYRGHDETLKRVGFLAGSARKKLWDTQERIWSRLADLAAEPRKIDLEASDVLALLQRENQASETSLQEADKELIAARGLLRVADARLLREVPIPKKWMRADRTPAEQARVARLQRELDAAADQLATARAELRTLKSVVDQRAGGVLGRESPSQPPLDPLFKPTPSAPGPRKYKYPPLSDDTIKDAVKVVLLTDAPYVHPTYGPIAEWDTSKVEYMSGIFQFATNFNGDLSRWDTSNVQKMYMMFWHAESFNGDLSRWDTSKVTNMTGVFGGARSFNGDLSRWDTSNVTIMQGTFNGATSFNREISLWDTSNVTDMSDMFKDATKFTGSLEYWNVSKLKNVDGVFGGMTHDLRGRWRGIGKYAHAAAGLDDLARARAWIRAKLPPRPWSADEPPPPIPTMEEALRAIPINGRDLLKAPSITEAERAKWEEIEREDRLDLTEIERYEREHSPDKNGDVW